jgi:ribosomal-protein-alanine N-acetyltransferase
LIRAITVRRMEAGDIADVMETAASLSDAPHWSEAAYLRAIDADSSPLRIALIAEGESGRDFALLGFVVASMVGPAAELESIAVAGQAQRRGVGRELMTALLGWLKEARAATVMLEVRASNRGAVEFYGTHGFRETGRRPKYYTNPQDDAILMKFDLKVEGG